MLTVAIAVAMAMAGVKNQTRGYSLDLTVERTRKKDAFRHDAQLQDQWGGLRGAADTGLPLAAVWGIPVMDLFILISLFSFLVWRFPSCLQVFANKSTKVSLIRHDNRMFIIISLISLFY